MDGIKKISSRRARALAIPASVKKAVYDRDDGKCVWCGRYGNPEAHFIPRSMGGLGIEENILTLCRECHEKYDHGGAAEREYMRSYFQEYLQKQYPDWDKEKIIYRRHTC